MKESRISEAILSAAVGGVVQALLQFAIAHAAQIGVETANIAAFPASFFAFLGVWYASSRRHKPQSTQLPSQPLTSTQSSIVSQEATDKTMSVDQLHEKDLEPEPELNTVLKELGIIGGTSRLSKSKYEPSECMSQAKKKLRFMGILGSKWVIEPHVRAEFAQFLKRIEAQKGSVHFLLINPNGPGFMRLKTLREGALSDESLQHFLRLMNDHPCLEVRLCESFPCFRLVFIDDRIVAVSRYKMDKEGYFKSKFGWEAPHLVIDSNAAWSLYDAFELYYDQVWDSAKDLGTTLGKP